MTIAFFEVQPWEEDLINKAFPDAVCTEDKLTAENAGEYKDAEIVSTFIYSTISRSILKKLPRLKFITTRSTGYDHVDTSACADNKIIVSNVPEYGSRTVAEHTFALILTLTKNIYQSISQVKDFEFEHDNIRGVDIYGKTLGIIGLGKIGIEVVKIANAFGMNVIVATRTHDKHLSKKHNFSYVSVEELLKTSDIVSLHLPYNNETHHTIGKSSIAHMKKGSYLINTARGGLIDPEAIVKGLEDGILAGVGLDVLEEEDDLAEEVDILTNAYKSKKDMKTLVLNHLLIKHPKVVITPHNAFNSKEALERIVTTTIENILSFQKQSPQNKVAERS